MPTATCKICNSLFEYDIDQKPPCRCYPCKVEQQNHWKHGKVVVKEEFPFITKGNSTNTCLKGNTDWFNAGIFCGKQGQTHDEYLSMREQGMMDTEIYEKIKLADEWQAEIKELTETQYRAWLLGFYKGMNDV